MTKINQYVHQHLQTTKRLAKDKLFIIDIADTTVAIIIIITIIIITRNKLVMDIHINHGMAIVAMQLVQMVTAISMKI